MARPKGLQRPGVCSPIASRSHSKVLDATVSEVGGMARAGWDNVYVVGPPEIVFPALDELRWYIF